MRLVGLAELSELASLTGLATFLAVLAILDDWCNACATLADSVVQAHITGAACFVHPAAVGGSCAEVILHWHKLSWQQNSTLCDSNKLTWRSGTMHHQK